MNSHPASLASRYLCLIERELSALARFPLHGATHEALRIVGVAALMSAISSYESQGLCQADKTLASHVMPQIQKAMRAEVSRASLSI